MQIKLALTIVEVSSRESSKIAVNIIIVLRFGSNLIPDLLGVMEINLNTADMMSQVYLRYDDGYR